MRDTMIVKLGVNAEINDEIYTAYEIAREIMESYGYECGVTSGRDGVHMENSLHYEGNAIDLRIYHIPEGVQHTICREIQIACGPDYDILHEGDHIHMEYDPS